MNHELKVKLKKLIKSNFFVLLVLTGVILLVFGQSISFSYVGLDEVTMYDNRLDYLSNPLNIKAIFLNHFNYPSDRIYQFYRPVLNLSMMMDIIIGGGEIKVYYLKNLLVHILASFFLYVLLMKLNAKKEVAFFLTLLFSVHPLVTVSIVWIPGIVDSLLAFFSILTFLFYINYLESKKNLYFILHILFFFLALFTKENAVVLLPICIYYSLVKDKKIIWDKKILVSWIAMVLAWFGLRYHAMYQIESQFIPVGSFLENFTGLFLYIYKLILPYNLTVFPTVNSVGIILGLIVAGGIVALWIYSKETRKTLNIGIIWMLFFLLSGLLSYEVPERMAFLEYRGYLVLIGFLIFISQLSFINNSKYKKYIIPILIILIIISGIISFRHSDNYRNDLNFWTKAVKDSPQLSRSHKGLGVAYFDRGRFEEAETEYKKAIEIYPLEPRTHKYLGNLYYDEGRDQEALEAYLKELKISKDESELLYKIAWLYARNGKFIEAEKYFLMMLDINKDHIPSHQDLVVLYFERGDYEKSKYHLQELRIRNAKLNSEVERINKIYLEK